MTKLEMSLIVVLFIGFIVLWIRGAATIIQAARRLPAAWRARGTKRHSG